MEITLKSLGAAGTVTGSKHLLTTPNLRILVDCGLFQGLKSLRGRNWSPLPIAASSIDVVLLTHAHLDHCGYIPQLVKQGFRGKIYANQPTMEMTKLILLDSAKLQEEEAENANRQHYSKHHPAKPLYTVAEARASFKYLVEVMENTPIFLDANCSANFTLAGHILGACSVLLSCYGKQILFSGDIGNSHSQILPPPAFNDHADYVIMESTYGDRLHPEQDIYAVVAEHINRAITRGGNVLIPSFAVGRAQEMLYILHTLKKQGKIPNGLPIVLDSPMGVSATEITMRFADRYLSVDSSVWRQIINQVKVNRDFTETMKTLNDQRPKVVVAASGMLTGGRVLEYLKHDLGNLDSLILLIGFQAEGTRGRALLNGTHELKIHGRFYQVKAQVAEVAGLSAHADQAELLSWLRHIIPAPKLAMLVHGEPCALEGLRVKICSEMDIQVRIMEPDLEVQLFEIPDSRDVHDRAIPLVPNSDNPFGRK